MTYQDAKEYLRIADNALNVEAYTEAVEIVEKLTFFTINKDNGLNPAQNAEITDDVKKMIGRFTYANSEWAWEQTSGLLDLFES